jgi:uncharacterized protein YecE (DUF72 family)
MGRIHVGTSGFVYPHWRGVFYPSRLPVRLWLQHYSSEFDTVELNATFYRLPGADAVERWRRESPPGFLFAAKGSRFLTHMKRLLDAERGVARFFEPVSRLGRKLAVVLWQLPPGWKVNAERLEAFLAALPRGVRHAFEFRDESWYTDEVCAVLDRHRAAFCEHDLVPRQPPRLTGGFRYLRFHGQTGKYRGRYGARALEPVAEGLARSALRGEAFVYFNNDVGGHAILDARALRFLLREVAAPLAPRVGSAPGPRAGGTWA